MTRTRLILVNALVISYWIGQDLWEHKRPDPEEIVGSLVVLFLLNWILLTQENRSTK